MKTRQGNYKSRRFAFKSSNTAVLTYSKMVRQVCIYGERIKNSYKRNEKNNNKINNVCS